MTALSFLIDTDWVIDHLNSLSPATKRLRQLEPQGLAVSIVTVAELWEGVIFSRDRQRSETMLREFIENVRVIAIDEETCQQFGQIRGSLRREGRLIGDLDLLIAASALRHSLTLLTNNRRHFENIEGLRIESLSE
jgi:tRNA(fMet)-specific endonuclease VapC